MITDYMVSYSNGSAGHFLMALIGHTVLDNVPSNRQWILQHLNEPLKAGQYNDAHGAGKFRNFRIIELRDKNGEIPIEEEFFMIHRAAPGYPVFLPTHFYWPEKQFQKWPNAKLAVILHTDDDLLEIGINSFYKTEMTQQWRSTKDQAVYQYSLNVSSNNVVFHNLRNIPPQALSREDLRIAVKHRQHLIITAGYHFIKPIDDPRITYIQYRDLVSNPDRVVEALQQITGKVAPPNVMEAITDYQTRQANFIAKIRSELDI